MNDFSDFHGLLELSYRKGRFRNNFPNINVLITLKTSTTLLGINDLNKNYKNSWLFFFFFFIWSRHQEYITKFLYESIEMLFTLFMCLFSHPSLLYRPGNA